MIREAAARKIASDLLEPYIMRDLATASMVETATKIILNAVETDELLQEIERLETPKVPA